MGDPEAIPPIPPAVVERYEYDPYGRTYIENGDSTVRRAVSKYGNPFAWTGQRYDAGVKLYGFFARAYSPELGRWLQRDPLGFVDGVNLYEYVRSMPTRLTDPLGRAAGYASLNPPTTSPRNGGDDAGPPDEDGPTAEPCEDGDNEPGNGDGSGSGDGSQVPEDLTVEQLIEILNEIRGLCPWLGSWIDSIIARLGEDIELAQRLIARILAEMRRQEELGVTFDDINQFVMMGYASSTLSSAQDDPYSADPVHAWVRENIWRAIHSDEELLSMSDAQMYTESITASVVLGAGGYYGVTYAVAWASGTAGTASVGCVDGSFVVATSEFPGWFVTFGGNLWGGYSAPSFYITVPVRSVGAVMERNMASNCFWGALGAIWGGL